MNNTGYTITLKFPDRSGMSHTDTFTENNRNDRTLWEITKTGTKYTATKDSFGSSGRIANSIQYVNK